MEPLELLILFRGIERLILASAGIVSIVVGAKLFKWGVYDHFEAFVERGDLKVRVATLAPGSVFGIVGVLLCCIGYFYGIVDAATWENPGGGGDSGEATIVRKGESSGTAFGGFGAEQVEFLQAFVNAIGNEPSEGKNAAAIRAAKADFLRDYCSKAANDLRSLEERIAEGATIADVSRAIVGERAALETMVGFLAEAAKEDADPVGLAEQGDEVLLNLKKLDEGGSS